MSHDIQIRSGDFAPDVAEPMPRGGPPENMDSLFTRIHRLLRGRYIWTLVLGSVLASIGGIAGFKLTEPLWTCSGMVQIKMDRDVVLSAGPENQSTQAPEAIKETQIALMRSQRIITAAMTSPDWVALKRPLTDDSIAEFMKKLTIASPGHSEIINVNFSDPDPLAATAAVKGVLGTYSLVYVDAETKAEDAKKLALTNRRGELVAIRDGKRNDIEGLASQSIGADDLRALHQANITTLTKLESMKAELQMTITGLEGAKTATTQAVKKSAADMTLAEIEQVDGVMRQLRRDLASLERDAQIKLTNLGPRNSRYEEAKLVVQLKKDEIESYATEWRAAALAAEKNPNVPLHPGDPAPVTLDQLKFRLAEYSKQYNALRDETLNMGRRMLLIEKYKREVADTDGELAEIDRRINQLNLEKGSAKRITVFNASERPLITKDSRAAYSAAGAIGGLGMGFALMMLLGLFDRSFRSPEDARNTARMPLLGILPNLPENLADPEQAAIAAHCVHQIRTLLQLGGGRDKRIFAITSPAAGTGKTSLTLSLGVSFAASNCRTLIIDCDLIGGGLTARVDTIVRRKLGDILRRRDLINDAQLAEALKLAEESGKRLGETLIELGYVKPADVEQALHLQHQDPVGMLDAIDGENVLDCIAETGIERLAILPLGTAMPTDVSKLSPAIIRSILDQARHHFDIVLVDTGPVPGSLEASVAAEAADGVVLVVSRGEHRPMAERSIQHLLDIGAKLAGMVFNRAQGRDMDLVTTTKRLSSFDRRGARSVSKREQAENAESKGFGPMALAVATKAPASGNGTRPRS